MAESIVSDVVVKLLERISKSAFKEIAHYFGGKAKLKELEQTMVMIQARLLDAERRGEGHNGEALVKNWLKGLKRVLYRLEDLLEEVTMKEHRPGGKLTKLVRLLSSDSNPLAINKKVAGEAKGIMNELTTITSLMNSLDLRKLHIEEPLAVNVKSSRETHSFVMKENVIGRDEDKKEIVTMLLNSDNTSENLSVIPIVGIGGLGKTTLAQLVFNDEDVQKHFELKGWACFSDISSLREQAGKILTSLSGEDYHHLTMEQIQFRVRQAVDEKRYLLVLDDMWDEDRKKWLDIRNFLCGSERGSKIIVTSRSKVVAQNMGTIEPYELGGLPEDKSWDLFRSLAFKPGQEGNLTLASIGREVVKKCVNVPLAIKTIACVLYSMDTEIEWEGFKDKDLTMLDQNENSILLTLKLSYDRLPSELKQCFAYCSLFPKDHVFLKRDLIYTWMAQGFLRSSNSQQSLEEVGHGYFMQMMRRCFFQDVERDEGNEIISCKMHDLMHDLAQYVAGGETVLVDGPTQKINDNILHVSFCSSSLETPSWLLATKQIRSFFSLHLTESWLNFGKLFSSFRCLRALCLANCKGLPDSLGELKHLRYLKLGGGLESLPECITRLQNLQTLDLCGYGSIELPRGFSKLSMLRHLHFGSDQLFDDMPPGFGQLTSLRALDRFVVGENNGLDALSTLNHLAGHLTIEIKKRRGKALSNAPEGILKDKKLTDLKLELGWYGADEEKDESALRCLQPPQSLKSLRVWLWKGVSFPSWGMDESPCLLPNLVHIEIKNCMRCQHLPSFSQLPHLRSLVFSNLYAVEYIEMDENTSGSEASSAATEKYFTSLESLTLDLLPKLKGWSKAEDDTIILPQRLNEESPMSLLPHPFFPSLSKLAIENCPKLKSMPLAPRLVSLKAEEHIFYVQGKNQNPNQALKLNQFLN